MPWPPSLIKLSSSKTSGKSSDFIKPAIKFTLGGLIFSQRSRRLKVMSEPSNQRQFLPITFGISTLNHSRDTRPSIQRNQRRIYRDPSRRQCSQAPGILGQNQECFELCQKGSNILEGVIKELDEKVGKGKRIGGFKAALKKGMIERLRDRPRSAQLMLMLSNQSYYE
jgi:hypothetical protein